MSATADSVGIGEHYVSGKDVGMRIRQQGEFLVDPRGGEWKPYLVKPEQEIVARPRFDVNNP
jgi:hypothetical protein